MIFSYHQVLAQPDPMRPGAVTAERFERQLRWIAQYCNTLPLGEAVERLLAGRLPERAAAVTFDDGYADNLDVAAPRLQKYGIPAVLFVAVDAVERGIMWNDVVIEAVRAARDAIDAGRIGLGVIAVDESNRVAVSRRLIGALKYRPVAERMEAALSLYESVSNAPLPRLMLEPARLRELPEAGFEVGAHTVNHPILRLLDESAARDEIEGSRVWLTERTGTAPTLFAYPNGKRGDDYDGRHTRIVQELGFRAAVSTNWGCATRRSSVYELPRFKPWEDTAARFYSRLCKVTARSYLP